MRLASVTEMRSIDERSRSEGGQTTEILMEAAGALAAREILQTFVSETRLGQVALLCGPGNNGGDGLVVARHLVSNAVRGVTAYLVGDVSKRTSAFNTQLKRCQLAGVPVIEISALPENFRPRIVIDALIGVGLSRELDEPYKSLILDLNQRKIPIVSIDSPSGLDADRGVARGAAIRAELTITFGLAKPGFFISDGPSYVGRLKVVPIGYSPLLVQSIATSVFAFDEKMARRYLPKRRATGNKSSNGHALLIAGHPGMWGAALLSSSSAFRVGAGYVTLASPGHPPDDVLKTYPEILTADALDEKLWSQPKWKAVGIGPGLGTNDRSLATIETLLKNLMRINASSVVVDADAITLLAKKKCGRFPQAGY